MMLTAVLGTENIVFAAVRRHGEGEEEKEAQEEQKEQWMIQLEGGWKEEAEATTGLAV